MFTLLVCSDVCGVKLNLEMPFKRQPTLDELRAKVDFAFYSELRAMERSGALPTPALQLLRDAVPPMFHRDGTYQDSGLLALHRIQVYDDSTLTWTDLGNRPQLNEYDQLYIFPKHRRHLSAEKDLPPPRLAVSQARTPPRTQSSPSVPDSEVEVETMATTTPFRGAYLGGSRSSARAALEDGRMKQTFARMDDRGKGHITVLDWRNSIHKASLRISDKIKEDIFRHFATATDTQSAANVMSLSDFSNFASTHSTLFAILSARLESVHAEEDLEADIEVLRERAIYRQRRQEELARELAELRAAAESEESKLRSVESDINAIRRLRLDTADEENRLIEKELHVVFQREQLKQEEAELAEATRRLDAKVRTPHNASTHYSD